VPTYDDEGAQNACEDVLVFIKLTSTHSSNVKEEWLRHGKMGLSLS